MATELKVRLNKAGLKNRVVADMAGIDRTEFSRLVSGKFIPGEREYADKVASAFSRALRQRITAADLWPGRGFEIGAGE